MQMSTEINTIIFDIEKTLPTIDEIKKEMDIEILSIKKFIFPKELRQRKYDFYATLSGAYIIVTINKEKYVGQTLYFKSRIDNHCKKLEILAIFLYETSRNRYITRKLEQYLANRIRPEINGNRKHYRNLNCDINLLERANASGFNDVSQYLVHKRTLLYSKEKKLEEPRTKNIEVTMTIKENYTNLELEIQNIVRNNIDIAISNFTGC